jgi:hypothetical protein
MGDKFTPMGQSSPLGASVNPGGQSSPLGAKLKIVLRTLRRDDTARLCC